MILSVFRSSSPAGDGGFELDLFVTPAGEVGEVALVGGELTGGGGGKPAAAAAEFSRL